MKTSKSVGIDDYDVYTFFRLHSSIYVWDAGGHHIDFQLSGEVYRWKGLAEIIEVTAKGKLHLHHPDTNKLMKGWHTDKVCP
jgi:hypothetical protein